MPVLVLHHAYAWPLSFYMYTKAFPGGKCKCMYFGKHSIRKYTQNRGHSPIVSVEVPSILPASNYTPVIQVADRYSCWLAHKACYNTPPLEHVSLALYPKRTKHFHITHPYCTWSIEAYDVVKNHCSGNIHLHHRGVLWQVMGSYIAVQLYGDITYTIIQDNYVLWLLFYSFKYTYITHGLTVHETEK